MKWKILIAVVSVLVQQIVAPPVQNVEEGPEDPASPVDFFEYQKYLKEVIDLLESDPEFRNKLQQANESDIRNGNIAEHLPLVNHQVRSKLDESKRIELLRLKHSVEKQHDLENDIKADHKDHLDHENPHTFEIDDLKKLISKTTQDLYALDTQRKEEFKNYEMNKQYNEDEHVKEIKDENARKQYVAEHETEKKKQKIHPALHTPGSKKQLEEVWEEQDGLRDQSFNPELFFQMHDTDGNNLWDQDEVKALFQRDIEKLQIDPYEKVEEMERMRENLFARADTNRNGMIDHQEYVNLVNSPQFQQDSGWTPMNEQEVYTQEEYDEYRRKMMELRQQQMAYEAEHANPNLQYPPQNAPGMQQGQQPVQQQYHGQVPVQQQPQHVPNPGYQQYQPPAHPQQYQVPRDQIPPEHQYRGEAVQKVNAQGNYGQGAPQQQMNHLNVPQASPEIPLNSPGAGAHGGNQAVPIANKI